MFKIIIIAIQVVAVGAGVFIGQKLKTGIGDSGANESHAEGGEYDDQRSKADHGAKNDDKGKSENKKQKASKDNSGKKTSDYGNGSQYGYLKFSRQFIVPIIRENRKNSLVVLDINLEVPSSITETAYSQEPKLRDAIMRSLLQSSNEGLFNDQLLESENLEDIRQRLLGAARSVLEDDVHQVLILSIARQDL
ncbi:MAG: flagellar basal body-associated FliL family protein [Marinicaulis sp.]|nr:flagellar basal body-associated FliL family protein [Marinicaulis sp.]